jgi:hypothetical protein
MVILLAIMDWFLMVALVGKTLFGGEIFALLITPAKVV